MTQVDFYVLPQEALMARLHYACRLAEKALHQGHHLVVAVDDQQQAQQMSEVLWSFKPESFLPHQLQTESGNAPIMVLWDEDRDQYHDVLINLSSQVPEWFSRFQRVLEIVIQEDDCLSQTRANFQFYRDRGYPLKSHNLRG